MERKILFKAKGLSDNKWVKGDLLHKGNKVYIYSPHINERGFFIESEEVDPSTVCQFTGLKDKNGKEIYDGDYLAHNGTIIGYVKGGVRGYCYDVIYTKVIWGEKSWSLYGVVVTDYNGDVEVVGNKFDRKEGKK